MPVTVPGITGVLIPALSSVGMLGQDMPRYARGVSSGVASWVSLISVTTVDVGTAGTGKNVPLPLTVPSPVLYGNLALGLSSSGFTGTSIPALALGLANGLSAAFLQMVISTNHTTVGVGGGVAKFVSPPAYSSIIQGLSGAGMTGEKLPAKARALGMALDATFASLVIPIAIVGPPSTTPSSGVGSGRII